MSADHEMPIQLCCNRSISSVLSDSFPPRGFQLERRHRPLRVFPVVVFSLVVVLPTTEIFRQILPPASSSREDISVA